MEASEGVGFKVTELDIGKCFRVAVSEELGLQRHVSFGMGKASEDLKRKRS